MPKNAELSTNEKLILRAYKEHESEEGQPPSKMWLAKQTKLHINTIHNAFKSLREKGYMQERNVTVVRLTLSAKGRRAANDG